MGTIGLQGAYDLGNSRFDFDRCDIRPTYVAPQRTTTRDDVRAMGCSDQTLALLFPASSNNFVLRQPEEWFWIDRSWFKGFPKASLDEIYQIAGGCFADLTLEEQASLLEIKIIDIVAEAAPGSGSWRAKDGTEVSIEKERPFANQESGLSLKTICPWHSEA
jgi:hypothetical protein